MTHFMFIFIVTTFLISNLHYGYCAIIVEEKEASSTDSTVIQTDPIAANINNQNVDTCSICQDAITVNNPEQKILTLPCNTKHIFHRSCITSWFDTKKKNPSCPICRTQFPNFHKKFLRALENNNILDAQFYVRYIFDVNKIRNDQGDHALYIAAGHDNDNNNGNNALVELLLKVGNADPNTCNNNGETALQEAAFKNNPNVIKTLYKYRAHVDQQTPAGDTALHFAASRGHFEAVEALLACNAHTAIFNQEGQTARDLALLKRHPDVVQLLESAS